MQVTPVLPTARQKFLQIFWGIIETFVAFKIFYLIYSTVSGETPNDDLQNRGCETLL